VSPEDLGDDRLYRIREFRRRITRKRDDPILCIESLGDTLYIVSKLPRT
jgi:hypothetical protein